MNQLDQELKELQDILKSEWSEVFDSLEKAKSISTNSESNDDRTAKKIEKKINKLDLKVEKKCESILALLNPLAIDLRKVIGAIHISLYLERIGKLAYLISKEAEKNQLKLDNEIKTAISSIFEEITIELKMALEALESDNSEIARIVFKDEKELEANVQVLKLSILTNTTTNDISNILAYDIVSKLELMSNHTALLTDQIIYILEAKNLKHKKLEKKLENNKPEEDEKN